ncbi:MAG TPA: ion transporter [Acidimicrobiia bacterium]|nr:ion transporter [Acidimicrobiia bacterium]
MNDTRNLGTNGHPRSAADADALTKFNQRTAFPLVLAAVIPLFLLPGGAYPVLSAIVFIAAWLVFVVDFVVHERRLVHYLLTWLGRFDLAVVVLTAPWFLLIGPSNSKFLLLIRLARMSRVLMATRGAERLFKRLGRVALIAVIVVFVGAAVGYRAEHATNAGFATFGDALWWAIVTLTTVGYGDIVPKTTAGRVDGVMIMITGVAILGLLAGALASFFHIETTTSNSEPDADTNVSVPAELAALRDQVVRLVDEVARLSANRNASPSASDDP